MIEKDVFYGKTIEHLYNFIINNLTLTFEEKQHLRALGWINYTRERGYYYDNE